MRMEDIDRLLNMRPFLKFRIHFSNGMACNVLHPEVARLSRFNIEVVTPFKNRRKLINRTDIFALIHIVRIEMLESHPNPTFK